MQKSWVQDDDSEFLSSRLLSAQNFLKFLFEAHGLG